MSKAVLISIQPKWCDLIANGEKTIEVRKTRPQLEIPFKCYIYCTLSGSNEFFRETCGGDVAAWNRSKMAVKKGMVIGEFVCDHIHKFSTVVLLGEEQTITDDDVVKQSCVSRPDLRKYETTKPPFGLYGWRISKLKIYFQPKKLSGFRKPLECHRGNDREDCTGCWDCEITRPPQSWCYVEESET